MKLTEPYKQGVYSVNRNPYSLGRDIIFQDKETSLNLVYPSTALTLALAVVLGLVVHPGWLIGLGIASVFVFIGGMLIYSIEYNFESEADTLYLFLRKRKNFLSDGSGRPIHDNPTAKANPLYARQLDGYVDALIAGAERDYEIEEQLVEWIYMQRKNEQRARERLSSSLTKNLDMSEEIKAYREFMKEHRID